MTIYEVRKTLMIAADRIKLLSTDPAGLELAERLLDIAIPKREFERSGRITFVQFCERYPELLARYSPQTDATP